VLAVPSVGSSITVASTVVPVWSALIFVAELVARKDSGSAPWVSQNPNVSEGVDVVWRVGVQGVTVSLRIMVGDECVGSAAGAGRVAVGFRVLERGDSAVLECRLESESILEGLSLTESGIFSGGDASSSTVVNLQWIAVSK
jgi:hypothetical protein